MPRAHDSLTDRPQEFNKIRPRYRCPEITCSLGPSDSTIWVPSATDITCSLGPSHPAIPVPSTTDITLPGPLSPRNTGAPHARLPHRLSSGPNQISPILNRNLKANGFNEISQRILVIIKWIKSTSRKNLANLRLHDRLYFNI